MRSVRPGHWCRPWAGALLAFLAWSALAPGVARAGCAHGGASGPEPAAHFELLARAGALPTPAAPEDRPAPCPGGICSRAPTDPAVPIVIPTMPAEPWACLASAPPLPIPGPGASIVVEGPAPPIRTGPSIFHPPRPATRHRLTPSARRRA